MTATITIIVKGQSELACRISADARGIHDMFCDEEIYPQAWRFHIAISHLDPIYKWFNELPINAHIAQGTLLWFTVNTIAEAGK